MTEEEIDKMADDFVNSQEFTKVYGIARKAECGAFWKKGFLAREKYIAELEKENKELKADNDARKFAMAMSEKVEKKLREENAELEAQIEKMKSDVIKSFGSEYNVLVAKLLKEWEINEK